MLELALSFPLPIVPVHIDDSPPGWLANLADWAIVIGAFGALATLWAPMIKRKFSEPRIEVKAERDNKYVYVHITNTGGKPGAIASVFLGVERPSATAGQASRTFHLMPNIKVEDFKPFMLKPYDRRVYELSWPGLPIYSLGYNAAGEEAYKATGEDEIRVIVRLFKDYKACPIELEPH